MSIRPVKRISQAQPTVEGEEPVAWYGPIVTNTQAELREAISELRSGAFIKP